MLLRHLRAAALGLVGLATIAAAPCASPQAHQFDFFLGSWQLVGADGKLHGHMDFTREYGGCALQEHWRSAKDPKQTGTSLNYYDPATKSWRQTWVDASGNFVELEGKLIGSDMVFHGWQYDGNKGRTLYKASWIPQKDGRIREHNFYSNDGGKTWVEDLDAYFVRDR